MSRISNDNDRGGVADLNHSLIAEPEYFPDFAEAARKFGELRIPVIPLGGDAGKKPQVRSWNSMTVQRSIKTSEKFPFANIGILCGRRSGITVVDIDRPGEEQLEWALETFGRSPIVVRTGSGKHHIYFRYNREPSQHLKLPGRKIDILGDGSLCVVPPSIRPGQGRYEFITGDLSLLDTLPTIDPDALQRLSELQVRGQHSPGVDQPSRVGDASIEPGQRNTALFDLGREIARTASSPDELDARLQEANSTLCCPSLPGAEVSDIARSCWHYKQRNRLWLRGGSQELVLDMERIRPLIRAGQTHALMLFILLKACHFAHPDKFAICPRAMSRARVIGSWAPRTYRKAANVLRAAQLIERLTDGGRHPKDPAQYRFIDRSQAGTP